MGGGGVWLSGQTDLQPVLQLLDRVTLYLTPRLKAELRQARPLLADKQRILSLSAQLSLSPASSESEEQMGDWGRQSGRKRKSGRAKRGARERYWGRNVLSLSTRAKRPWEGPHYWHFSSKDCLANSYRDQVARCCFWDLRFQPEKKVFVFALEDMSSDGLGITQAKCKMEWFSLVYTVTL